MAGGRNMYVTLPSNTPDYANSNRTNCFRVRLPEPVQLFGAWEVALVDIQYPYSWRNLPGRQELMLKYKTASGASTRLKGVVPPGYYRDVSTLLDGVRLGIRDAARYIPVVQAMEELVVQRLSIMRQFPHPQTDEATRAEVNDNMAEASAAEHATTTTTTDRGNFKQRLPAFYRERATSEEVARDDALFERWAAEQAHYDQASVEDAPESELEHAFDGSLTAGMGRVKVRVAEGKSINALQLPPTIRYMLGFSSEETLLLPGRTYRARYQPDLTAGLTTLYVHCSIVEPQVVGNCRSELLRTIPIDSTHAFGDTVHELFTSPHYVSVLRRCFDQIHIEIRTDAGELVPFEHGKVVVKLHFRKARGLL